MQSTDKHMYPEDLRPGQIFVDGSNRNRRIVILRVMARDLLVWITTVGGTGEPRMRSTDGFYWSPITPHRKWRRSGYYLDPAIPGNVPKEHRDTITTPGRDEE